MRQSGYDISRVPILQVTLTVIAEVDPKGLLTLDVTLVAPEDSALSRDEHMNFDQQLWKSITANRKVRIIASNGLRSRWVQQFLEIASNVYAIHLGSYVYEDAEEHRHRIGRVSSLSALTHWPDLSQLVLCDMVLTATLSLGSFELIDEH